MLLYNMAVDCCFYSLSKYPLYECSQQSDYFIKLSVFLLPLETQSMINFIKTKQYRWDSSKMSQLEIYSFFHSHVFFIGFCGSV